MNEVAISAVLTDAEILELSDASVDANERLIDGILEDNLKGAAYDLRMAQDGMVLPNGKVILPNGEKYASSIVVNPGQTVFVSTLEQLTLPLNVTGNMAIKGELASKNMIALTGLIVDPGYHLGGSGDGRLHFRLANLGSRPVLLEPGKTKIASIQFLRMAQDTTRAPGTSFDNIWDRTVELREGLGFFEDLRKLERRAGALETQLAEQGRTVNVVVVAGLFLVVATLLGTAVAAFLSLGSDSKIVGTARSILPHNTGLKVLFVVGMFGFATIVYAIASVVRVQKAKPPLTASSTEEMRAEAVQLLRARRYRNIAVWSVIAALLLTGLTALSINAGVPWYFTVPIGLLAALAALWTRRPTLWWPITRATVDEQIREWESEAQPEDARAAPADRSTDSTGRPQPPSDQPPTAQLPRDQDESAAVPTDDVG